MDGRLGWALGNIQLRNSFRGFAAFAPYLEKHMSIKGGPMCDLSRWTKIERKNKHGTINNRRIVYEKQ